MTLEAWGLILLTSRMWLAKAVAERYNEARSRLQNCWCTQVVTYTSDLRGAGTDATVFVELAGELGSGPRCKLMNQAGAAADAFGRGQTDTFVVQLPELGELQSLTIGESLSS